ncbi:MAG: pilus assembly PilX N-terminal domain-containing protein [Sedimentisphaerales bacterium]|nr:pilus assembly PilX N-terminal domain-containing protein [Sedimentisphaerales bacterium]
MAPAKKKSAQQSNRGAVLIVSMIFVLIFSALAISMATMSGTNVQLASNQHKVGSAIASTESGLETMRFWLNRVQFPSSTPTSDYHDTIVSNLRSDLSANSITNITVYNNGIIPSVPLDSTTGQAFEGELLIDLNNANILQLSAKGGADITRKIRVQYDIQPYEYPIFDFGLATKGPVHFLGNPTVNGVNSNDEADIFIESNNNNLAMLVTGNTNFDGDISVGNSIANVSLMGDIQIAGDSGQTAIDNHVNIGVESPQFPDPDTLHFQQYATGPVIDSSTDLSAPGMVLTNATIAAGTDPNFLGNVTIEGILYIEQPNEVIFSKNVKSQGMIVAEGDPNFASPSNSITFLGQFATNPVPAGVQFDAIRQEEGSSILAPAFSVEFAGNFSALSGVMAVSGVHFSGNVNAIIEGTIINYSDNPTIIEGNAVLNFDRSNNITVPAGFDTHRILTYNPASYEELPQ